MVRLFQHHHGVLKIRFQQINAEAVGNAAKDYAYVGDFFIVFIGVQFSEFVRLARARQHHLQGGAARFAVSAYG